MPDIDNNSIIKIEKDSTEITNLDQLAESLAEQTRLISNNIIDGIQNKSREYKPIIDFSHSVKKHLIHDLSDEEFADLYAQTITFGLFTAVIMAKGNRKRPRRDLLKSIPNTNIVLHELFEYISGNSIPTQLEFNINRIIAYLRMMKSGKLLDDYIKERNQDPLIHFYETFLSKYNPNLRQKLGVYYTPRPVVSFIVKSIHLLLQEKFLIAGGLANHESYILDPAAGTSAFLWEAVNLAAAEFASRYGKGMADRYGYHYLLERVYGFELIPAAYAISHLKLNLLLKSFNASLAEDERLHIYLTDTLDLEDLAQRTLPGMDVLSVEAQRAAAIKHTCGISVIMGNPPYSLSNSKDADNKTNRSKYREKPLINELMDDYKKIAGKRLGERNLKWLQEDYVRFIRFAQWKIDQTGKGIIGFITNHSYLDNPTFRGMRRSLMQSFDEIYILDLHGNIMRSPKTPEGKKDENIFDIRQGAAISLFVKTPLWKKNLQSTGCKVYFSEIWGTREEKYNLLMNNNVSTIDWKPVQPIWNFYLFNRVSIQPGRRNVHGIPGPDIPSYKLTDIFPVYGTGIITGRDHLCIRDSAGDMYRTVSEFSSLPEDQARKVFKLPHDSRDWQVKLAQRDILESSENGVDKNKILPILYRPFDIHYTYYTGKTRGFLCMPRPEVMGQMLKDNIALISVRQVPEGKFNHCFAADTLIESRVTTSNKGICFVFPLYFYPDTPDTGERKIMRVLPFTNTGNDRDHEQENEKRQVNIHPEFLEVLKETMKIKNTLLTSGELAEQVFYYIYAILYAPGYRKTHAHELKIDFPHIPFPSDYDLFSQLSELGKRLVDLHLMKSMELNQTESKFDISGSDRVEKITYVTPRQLLSQQAFKQVEIPISGAERNEGRIYINDSQYISRIKPAVWEYTLCGYPILYKWLKIRRNKKLSHEDIRHFIRMVRCIRLTMEYQEKIDKLYKQVVGIRQGKDSWQ